MDSRALNTSAFARLKARIGGEARRWLAEEPPGEVYASGQLPPSLTDTARITAARSLSSLLPYESYDPDTKLWWNSDSVAFLLEVMPAVGLDRSALNTLSGLLSFSSARSSSPRKPATARSSRMRRKPRTASPPAIAAMRHSLALTRCRRASRPIRICAGRHRRVLRRPTRSRAPASGWSPPVCRSRPTSTTRSANTSLRP